MGFFREINFLIAEDEEEEVDFESYFESDFESDFDFKSDLESDFGSDNLISLSYSEAAFSANLFGLFF